MSIWNKIKEWFGRKEETFAGTEKDKAYKIVLEDLNVSVPVTEKKEVYCDVRVGTLKKAIYYYFPPFTWERIGLLLYKDFMNYGKAFGNLRENDCLPKELVIEIDKSLHLLYKKGLPKEVLTA